MIARHRHARVDDVEWKSLSGLVPLRARAPGGLRSTPALGRAPHLGDRPVMRGALYGVASRITNCIIECIILVSARSDGAREASRWCCIPYSSDSLEGLKFVHLGLSLTKQPLARRSRGMPLYGIARHEWAWLSGRAVLVLGLRVDACVVAQGRDAHADTDRR